MEKELDWLKEMEEKKEKQKQYREKKDELNWFKQRKKAKEKRRDYVKRRNQLVYDYKKVRSCIKCGYREHPEILQFHHHKNNKSFTIASKMGKIGDNELIREMEKCVLLCPNCHLLLHSKKGTNDFHRG